jgi:tetratricopeptide (TPR) repeat protein
MTRWTCREICGWALLASLAGCVAPDRPCEFSMEPPLDPEPHSKGEQEFAGFSEASRAQRPESTARAAERLTERARPLPDWGRATNRAKAIEKGARAVDLVREGRVSLALEWAVAFSETGTDTVPAQYTLACIHEETDNTQAERAALDATLRIDPEFPQARQMRGTLRRGQEDYAGAIEDFTAVLVSLPEDLSSLEGRGLTYLLQGDPEKALADFQRVLKNFPGRMESALRCAEALDDLGQNLEAVSVISKARGEWPPGSYQYGQLEEVLRGLYGK